MSEFQICDYPKTKITIFVSSNVVNLYSKNTISASNKTLCPMKCKNFTTLSLKFYCVFPSDRRARQQQHQFNSIDSLTQPTSSTNQVIIITCGNVGWELTKIPEHPWFRESSRFAYKVSCWFNNI